MIDQSRLERAWLLYEQRRYPEALEAVGRSLQQQPNDSEAHFLLALTHLQLQQQDRGIAAAQESIRLAPDEPRGHYGLALLYCNLNQYGKASAALEEALQLAPETPDLHWLRGAIAFDQQHWQGCLDATAIALQLLPDHGASLGLRARCLMVNGRDREAATLISAALAHQPEDANALAIQGQLQLRAQAFAPALASFRAALGQDPSNALAQRGLIAAINAQNPVYQRLLWLHSPAGLKLLIAGAMVCLVALLLLVSQVGQDGLVWALVFPIVGLLLLGLGLLPWAVGLGLQVWMLLNRRDRRLFNAEQIGALLLELVILISVLGNLLLQGWRYGPLVVAMVSVAVLVLFMRLRRDLD